VSFFLLVSCVSIQLMKILKALLNQKKVYTCLLIWIADLRKRLFSTRMGVGRYIERCKSFARRHYYSFLSLLNIFLCLLVRMYTEKKRLKHSMFFGRETFLKIGKSYLLESGIFSQIFFLIRTRMFFLDSTIDFSLFYKYFFFSVFIFLHFDNNN
jgi:hypothetical protein